METLRLGNWSEPFAPAARGEQEVCRIQALQAGSEEAFNLLIAEYAPAVYRLAYRLLNERADASDTVQEVFLKVFRNIAGFQGHCSLKTWIYRITVNTASNQNRSWRRHREQECPLEAPESEGRQEVRACADDHPNPFESAASHETQEMVQKAMERLKEPWRMILVLREVEGLSYDEMAEILHISVGTVRSRLARARQSLKRELESVMEPAPHGLPVWSPAE